MPRSAARRKEYRDAHREQERAYRKTYRETHRDVYSEAQKAYRSTHPESTRARYLEFRAWLDAIKLAAGCIDCGYNAHPAALDFDHRDPAEKLFGIASNWRLPRKVLLAEIAKCDVRCANCHRVRGAKAGHFKKGKIPMSAASDLLAPRLFRLP